MPYNDYIIAVDENGQPYIAHAYNLTNMKYRQVKYLLKLKDGKRTRYFYTQDEIDAYYRKKKKQKERKRPTSHKKNVAGTAKSGWNKRRSLDDSYKNGLPVLQS